MSTGSQRFAVLSGMCVPELQDMTIGFTDYLQTSRFFCVLRVGNLPLKGRHYFLSKVVIEHDGIKNMLYFIEHRYHIRHKTYNWQKILPKI